MAPHKYGAVFSQGGSDYLYVRDLGEGLQGHTCLVRGVDDGRLYVKKKTVPDELDGDLEQLPEVRQIHHHPNIPELISAVAYPVLKEDHPCHDAFRPHSIIYSFCNGGTLKRLIRIREFDRSFNVPPVLAWKLFDQLLDVFRYLHGPYPSIAHCDAHFENIFLHWPSDDARLPDFYLGDFGYAEMLDSIVWEATSTGSPQLASATSLASQEDINAMGAQVQKIRGDLSAVVSAVTYLCGGFDHSHIRFQNLQTGEELRGDSWPADLISAVHALSALVNAVAPPNWDAFNQLHRLADHVKGCRAWHEQQLHEAPDLRFVRTDRYDFALVGQNQPLGAVEDQNDIAGPNFLMMNPSYYLSRRCSCAPGGSCGCFLASHYPRMPLTPTPALFGSRSGLFANCEELPGPWNVARVDPDTLEVLGVERLTLNLHLPFPGDQLESIGATPRDLIPTIEETYGFSATWEAADKVEMGDAFVARPPDSWYRDPPSEGTLNEIIRSFDVNPNWRAESDSLWDTVATRSWRHRNETETSDAVDPGTIEHPVAMDED